MDFSVNKNWQNHDPGILLGVMCYMTALLAYLLQTRWRIGYSDAATFILPILPWLLTVGLLLRYRKHALKGYWWVLPTIIIANPTFLLLCLMMLAWSIGGFV
jgi:hypothetical protein